MNSSFTERDVLKVYAKMLETLSVKPLALKLMEDFRYTSAWAFDEINSRDKYQSYIRLKLEDLKASRSLIWTKLGRWGDRPCLSLSQDQEDNHVATVFVEIANNTISATVSVGS